MRLSRRSLRVAGLLATVGGAGCSSAVSQSAHTTVQSGARSATTPAEQARADSGRMPFTAADVHFMQGMIHHHAQAVIMAGWAQTHDARPDVKGLAQRIDVAQRDEIAFMQRWLRERHLDVPDPLAHYEMGHDMPAMSPSEMMPGMLTSEQMKQLDAARGQEFDRLFLTFMIQHHQGALTMVHELFSHPGAGQELYVFRFASDVEADQNTEIERMRLMLGASTR